MEVRVRDILQESIQLRRKLGELNPKAKALTQTCPACCANLVFDALKLALILSFWTSQSMSP